MIANAQSRFTAVAAETVALGPRPVISASAFVAGDIVRLKSGGPLMTVEYPDQHSCTVSWFVGEARHTADVAPRALRKANWLERLFS